MSEPAWFKFPFQKKPGTNFVSVLEPFFFCLFLVAGLINVWSSEFFLSLDGPAHLYNAKLLGQIDHSPFLQKYYTRSSIYLPNYFTNSVLSCLMRFFDGITSEKILISFIVTFIPLSFRTMVNVIRPEKTAYTALIFLLPFSKLLHVGFYNFMAAFVFFNIALILFYRLLRSGPSIGLFVLTTVNALLLYYSHALVFALAGVTILFLLVFENGKAPKRIFGYMLSLAFMYGIPIVMYVFFVSTFAIPDYNYDIPSNEKVEGLIMFQDGITFQKHKELENTALVPLLLAFFAGSSISLRERQKKWSDFFRVSDVFMLISLGMFYLIFHSKDGQFGGMFVHRISYIAFYFVIIWLLCNLKTSWFNYLFSLSVVLVIYFSLSLERHKYTAQFDKYIKGVISTENYIQDSSLVYTIILSDVWHLNHLSGYLGLNKKLVLNDNYEAILDWFPLKFKKDVIYPFQLPLDVKSDKKHYPDYVYVFGDVRFLEQEKYRSSAEFLNQKARCIYNSKDEHSHLYKVIKN
jgi:hypothetical protein